MSKWERLLKRIRNMSKDVRFNEIKKILEGYGYTAYNPSVEVVIEHLENQKDLQ